ncbi:hypothetical protein ES703_37181 [subsurface metagenome]
MQIVVNLSQKQVLNIKAILEKPDDELSVQDARTLKRMLVPAIRFVKV